MYSLNKITRGMCMANTYITLFGQIGVILTARFLGTQ